MMVLTNDAIPTMEKDVKEKKNKEMKVIASVSSSSSSSSSTGSDEDMSQDNKMDTISNKNQLTIKNSSYTQRNQSKLFVPHRTIGIVTSGKGFTWNSTIGTGNGGGGDGINDQTFLSVPIGDRFQIIRCDKLAPVLVSEALPSPRRIYESERNDNDNDSNTNNRNNILGSNEKKSTTEMYFVLSDPSLSISVAAYRHSTDRKSHSRCTNIALYHRTKAIQAIHVFERVKNRYKRFHLDKKWNIVQMLSLGRLKLKKADLEGIDSVDDDVDDVDDKNYGSKEMHQSCLLIALICSSHKDEVRMVKTNKRKMDLEENDIEMVGDSSSDEEDSDDDDDDNDNDNDNDDNKSENKSISSSSDDDSTNTNDSIGQGCVIILAVSRHQIYIWNYIPLLTESTLAHKTETTKHKTLSNSFHPICACHPNTYMNKLVIGGTKGQLHLINIRTRKLIHKFKCCLSPDKPFSSSTTAKYDITVLQQSPAIDTLAVGTSGGNVHLINLKYDTLLFTLSHKHSNSSIVSLSFRTDSSAASAGIAPLAIGKSNGSIDVWDLTDSSNSKSHDSDSDQSDQSDDENQKNASMIQRRRLLYNMSECHPGGLAHLTFLPFEPVLITSGFMDNSIKMHIFDSPDFSARLLRSRSGHFAPPRYIRYLHGGTGGNGGLLMANIADGTDAASCQILSAASQTNTQTNLEDRTLRIFSTVRSILDKEYSQGKGLEKKAKALGLRKADLLLPEITMFATCEARSRDWGDLVSIHKNHAHAYVWSNRRGAQSGPVLRQDSWNISSMKVPPPEHCHATSVTISTCGNFAIVGTKGGVIYKYNVQSGLPRGSYPRDATAKEDEALKKHQKLPGSIARTMKAFQMETKMDMPSNLEKQDKIDKVLQMKMEKEKKERRMVARHNNSTVVGVAVDSLNRTLVSVGSDGKLIVWSFVGHIPYKKSPFYLPCAATKLCHIRDNDLAAIALEDFTILIFDCSSQSIVRRFGGSKNNDLSVGHTGPVTDLGFGPDGRRLMSSSLDGTIRVWDVPTGSCVDWLSFPTPPTSLTLSATGEFLATSHVGQVGISLWCDKSFFQTVFLDGQLLEEPAYMDNPSPIAEHMDPIDLEAESKARMIENTSMLMMQSNDNISSSLNSGTILSNMEGGKVIAKGTKLITMSGLQKSHWRTLFHLELVRERNKPREPPKKPPTAPFFLQWRGEKPDAPPDDSKTIENKDDSDIKIDDKWDAAWSDEEDDELVDSNEAMEIDLPKSDNGNKKDKESKETNSGGQPSSIINTGDNLKVGKQTLSKKRKVVHLRSHLAGLLQQCFASKSETSTEHDNSLFTPVTQHMSTMGPSAIDVALSTLCHGMHDLDEGLPLLHLCSLWLLEACDTRQNFEVINAYLNRFLSIHSNVIAGIEYDARNEDKSLNHEHLEEKTKLLQTIGKLRKAQTEASESLRGKMQNTMCLLKHFSRMI